MTDTNKVALLMVVDESGSMQRIAGATRDGFNEYIEQQKNDPEVTLVSVIKFNDALTPLFELVPVQEVPVLDATNYTPDGTTALYDAIGTMIDRSGELFAAMDESERPGKVMLMVFTDGAENASRTYSQNKVAEMVKHQQDKYGWAVKLIGADIDTVAVGKTMNIDVSDTVSYSADASSTRGVYESLSIMTKRFKSSV